MHIDVISALIARAPAYYNVGRDKRLYHNWAHALDVVENIGLISGNPSVHLTLAGYWHDAVYYPGHPNNESESAIALMAAFADISADHPEASEYRPIVHTTMELIEQTKITDHLTCEQVQGDLAVLLDSDLNAFQLPYEQFRTKQFDIILENGGNVVNDKAKSAQFLKQFLTARPYIFHTDVAREHWESIARKNITRWCKEAGV